MQVPDEGASLIMAEAVNLFCPYTRRNYTKRESAQKIRETDALQAIDEMPSQNLLVLLKSLSTPNLETPAPVVPSVPSKQESAQVVPFVTSRCPFCL